MLHSTPPYAVLCCSDAVFIYGIHTVQWHDRKCKISWVTSSSSVWSIVMASCMNERILGWMSFKPSRIYVCTNGGKWSSYEISVSPHNLNERVILHQPHIHNSHTHTFHSNSFSTMPYKTITHNQRGGCLLKYLLCMSSVMRGWFYCITFQPVRCLWLAFEGQPRTMSNIWNMEKNNDYKFIQQGCIITRTTKWTSG